jgi:seryl-tRNA synthetase
LEKRKKQAEEAAVDKEVQRDRKIRTIGNYVHESVPVSNDEVWSQLGFIVFDALA